MLFSERILNVHEKNERDFLRDHNIITLTYYSLP